MNCEDDHKAIGTLDLRIQHLSELVDAHRIYAKEALTLQAREYERRLKELNNEAARLKAASERSVSAERYDAHREADQRVVSDLRRAQDQIREETVRLIAERSANAKWIAVGVSLFVSLVVVTFSVFLNTGP